MSRYPFVIEFERPTPPRRLVDQHFGLGITPQDYLALLTMPAQSNENYYRPWRNMSRADHDVGSTIKQDKDKFQVNIDVQHFRPEEISVKTVDGFLVVEAKHDERTDGHGFISRNFTRRYPLPEGVNPDLIVSKLSSDGVLTVTAPRNVPPKNADERIVPIVRTGPVRKQEQDAEQ